MPIYILSSLMQYAHYTCLLCVAHGWLNVDVDLTTFTKHLYMYGFS